MAVTASAVVVRGQERRAQRPGWRRRSMLTGLGLGQASNVIDGHVSTHDFRCSTRRWAIIPVTIRDLWESFVRIKMPILLVAPLRLLATSDFKYGDAHPRESEDGSGVTRCRSSPSTWRCQLLDPWPTHSAPRTHSTIGADDLVRRLRATDGRAQKEQRYDPTKRTGFCHGSDASRSPQPVGSTSSKQAVGSDRSTRRGVTDFKRWREPQTGRAGTVESDVHRPGLRW